MGVVNAVLVLALSEACEMRPSESYFQLPQHEEENPETIAHSHVALDDRLPEAKSRTWSAKFGTWFTTNFTQISAPTRSIMYKLWFLLSVDSLADGMVPYSLTNYFMDMKFHPSTSTLGDVTSISYFLGAIGALFAGPLARKIGLINTMVFTHVPSSAAVLFFPFPPRFWMMAALLLLRTALNNMDQAPRSAFIAAVVKPEERTAVMGITGMLRTLAAMAGPTVTGVLAANQQFWIAFVAAGVCRLAYDFGLWMLFVNVKLHQHETKGNAEVDMREVRRSRDEEEVMEMASLASSETEENEAEKEGSKENVINKGLEVPQGLERIRSRSPHRSAAADL
ncbi:MAG: hypothetical protein Q9227_005812 [Pyrenula ochraceoflavens]